MEDQHKQNHKKLQEIFAQLQGMPMVTKSKMWKFYRNVGAAYSELDKEYVNCRRVKTLTSKYKVLEKNYYECITVFEQWSIMATLMFD